MHPTIRKGSVVVDRSCTADEEISAVANVLLQATGGVAWAYQALEHVASRHGLSGAWLVLHPEPGGTQLFSLHPDAEPSAAAAQLVRRPVGVYGEPDVIDPATSTAVGMLCDAAFRTHASAMRAALDTTGLASSTVIDAALARATACAARYGWSSTAVLLTTTGEGAPDERWAALAGALRQALRSGDECGVAGSGTAIAILGNAGPDAVRPFIGRVRAALNAAGWEGADLHCATASTPQETVDPVELRRLAGERLAQIDAVATGTSTSTSGVSASTLELELRLVPGVVCVAMGSDAPGGTVTIVCTSQSDALHDELNRRVRAHLSDVPLRVVALSDHGRPPHTAGHATDTAPSVRNTRTSLGNGHGHGNGHSHSAARAEMAGTRLLSATAPGAPSGATAAGGTSRVTLVDASFDPARGISQVSLAYGAARGTGRAPAGPLAGGAQATLTALGALGMDVPFYLVSAERMQGVPGDAVVVVLAPREASGTSHGTAERIGVATGARDVDAASRATLGALNRFLSRGVTAS